MSTLVSSASTCTWSRDTFLSLCIFVAEGHEQKGEPWALELALWFGSVALYVLCCLLCCLVIIETTVGHEGCGYIIAE